MLTPKEFIKLWSVKKEKLIKYPTEIVEKLSIPEDSKLFLIEAGLPSSAAPFLSFGPVSVEKPLISASRLWGLPESFSCYRVIGSTGFGDSICIDESENGIIIYLDHEVGFKKIFINSSVMKLAESLLAYRHFVERTIKERGQDAYLEFDIPIDLRKWIINEMRKIDILAVNEGCFWKNELNVLKV